MSSTVEIVIKGKDQASPAFRSADKAAARLGASLAKIGGAAVKVGLLAAAGAATALGVGLASCIGPASDLSETVNKVGVVFGEQADEILKFGENSATALGMSKNEALSAAATYGNLFRSMGMTEDASAGMSTSLVQLAADLGSFNNIPAAEALEKLRAGLTGETEPLKSLGVNLNEATIKQRALEMGLWDGKGALDASAKAQAAYSLIMEQTSLAQGDFERTSGGLANQQKILGSTIEDIKSKIGTGMLPLLTKLASKLSETLAKPETQAAIQKVADSIGAIADKLGTAAGYFTEGKLGEGLAVLFGAETALKILDVKEKIEGFANFVRDNLTPILAGLGAAILTVVVPAFIAWAVAAWAAMAPLLPIIALALALGVVIGLLVKAWQKDWGGIRTTITKAWEEHIKPALEALWKWISVELPLAFLKAKIWIQDKVEDIKRAIGEKFEAIKNFLAQTWATIKLKVELTWALILAAIKDAIAKIIAGIKEKAETIKNNIIDPIIRAKDAIVGKIKEYYNLGRDLLNGLIDGVKSMVGNLIDSVTGAISDAIDKAKELLGIGSPSKVMAKMVGKPMAQGIAAGFSEGLANAMRNLSRYELPRMMAGLQMQVQGAPGGAPGGRAPSSSTQIHHHWNLTINSSATTENLVADFAMLRAMAG